MNQKLQKDQVHYVALPQGFDENDEAKPMSIVGARLVEKKSRGWTIEVLVDPSVRYVGFEIRRVSPEQIYGRYAYSKGLVRHPVLGWVEEPPQLDEAIADGIEWHIAGEFDFSWWQIAARTYTGLWELQLEGYGVNQLSDEEMLRAIGQATVRGVSIDRVMQERIAGKQIFA